MVSIPVRLVPAVRRRSVSFNQLDADTMSRIRYRKVSDSTGEEVPAERIVRAANVGGDNYVVVTDDELASLAPERSKEIAIEAFVPVSEIDPMAYDSSFHVVPDTNGKPYALLAQALAGTDRVAVGRFVMRQKEHLAAMRSDGEHLTLSTMVFPDELVDPASIEEFEVLEGIDLSERELAMAGSLVEAMSEEFQPERYVDEHRVALEHLIEQKAAGQPVSVAQPAERSTVIDLAEALEASLRDAQTAKGRHPSSRTGRSDGVKPSKKPSEPREEAAEKKPVERKRTRKSA
jgi:DNA end-binding protein Ku